PPTHPWRAAVPTALFRRSPPTAPDRPSLHLRACARRAVHNARHAGICVIRSAVSAPLGLAWRLDVTIVVDAEVVTEDRDTAKAILQRLLRDTGTHVIVYQPYRGPGGWRQMGSAPIARLHDIRIEHDGVPDEPMTWSATAVVTASIVVAARDADTVDSYSDIEA